MRRHFTYANVISTLCLFLLLGGGAYAALKLPKNSVGSKQLKKNAVTTAKIKKEAVTGSKVKKGSLTGDNVQDGSLTGSDIQDGSLTGVDISQSSLNDVRAANALGVAITKDETCSPAVPPPSGVTSKRAGIGRCILTFPNPVSNCAATAAVHFRPTKLEAVLITDRTTQLFSSNESNVLGVETFEEKELQNLPFDLTIIC